MIFPLRKIIDFAIKNPTDIDKAYREFFGALPFSQLKSEWEELFLEWLVFDFKNSSGTSFLIEYIFKNPDHLADSVLNQFQEIAETNKYSHFEILKIKRREWFELEDLCTGNTYKVFDKKGSESVPSLGIIPARIACVESKWYLVGASPVFFPLTYTKRAKKNIQKMNSSKFSPKDTVDLLRHQQENPPKIPDFLQEDLRSERLNLKKRYENLAKRSQLALSFNTLIEEIYQEDGTNVLDFWQGLGKKGLKFEVFANNTEIFNDIWNCFPHKCLNDLSPVEAFAELKKDGRKKEGVGR